MTLRVLIVGAGIAGLALARALRLRGIAAEVVERTAEWEASGAGLYLPGNSVRALDELGIWEELAARCEPDRAAAVSRPSWPRARGHRRSQLLGRGRDRVSRFAERRCTKPSAWGASRVPVRLGLSVSDLDDDGQSKRVRFSDGSTGTYDLVVGADGVHSTIRTLAFAGSPARYVGQASWRFVADGFPEIGEWTVMLGRGRAFLTVALGEGSVYCYADVNSSDGPPDTRGGAWRELFADFADPVPRLLQQADDAYYAPIEEVAPPAWKARRVVLVGDAAHASSPNMAQGAAMALEDALVLADALATSQDIEEALERVRATPGRACHMGTGSNPPTRPHAKPASVRSQHDATPPGRTHFPFELSTTPRAAVAPPSPGRESGTAASMIAGTRIAFAPGKHLRTRPAWWSASWYRTPRDGGRPMRRVTFRR